MFGYSPSEVKAVAVYLVLYANCTSYNNWMFIYPFLGSYLHQFNPAISMSFMFSCYIWMFVGLSIGNWLFVETIKRLGFIRSIQVAGPFYLLNGVMYYAFSSRLMVAFNSLVTGVLLSFVTLSCLMLFNLNNKQTSAELYGTASSGYSFGSFIWVSVISWILNPQNLLMEETFDSKGKIEHFFPKVVADRFPLFAWICGIITCLCLMILPIFLEQPKGYGGSWFGETQPVSERKKSIEQELQEMRMSVISVESKPGEQPLIIGKFDEIKTITSRAFVGLFILTYARSTGVTYYIDNYKYFSYFILHDESLAKKVFVWGSFFAIASRFVSGKFSNYFGFKKGTFILLIVNITVDLCFLFFRENVGFFIFLIQVARTSYSFNLLFNGMSLFALYPVIQAAKLMKYFELYWLVALVHITIFNSLSEEGSYNGILGSFVLLDVIAIYVYYKFLD